MTARVCSNCSKTPSFVSMLASMSPKTLKCSHCGHPIRIHPIQALVCFVLGVSTVFLLWWAVIELLGLNMVVAYITVMVTWVAAQYVYFQAILGGRIGSDLIAGTDSPPHDTE